MEAWILDLKNGKMRCDNPCCGKEFTPDMEMERSDHLTETFCSPDCAMDRYFDRMGSLPLTDEQKSELFRTNESAPPTSRRKPDEILFRD